MSWNINGWFQGTKTVRSNVISGLYKDIVVLCETHLKGEDCVNVDGYISFNHNRLMRNIRAKKNYGGVCILVKNSLCNYYVLEIVDKSKDGILAIKFSHKYCEYSFLVIGLYLPPENSIWGRDAAGFFAHLLQLVYEHSDCDFVTLTGDINAKLGSSQDIIQEVDSNVGTRKVLDKSKNKHGQDLLEFLLEAKLCICNGRVTPNFDNYTFVHSRGKSVIDYTIVPLDCISNCSEFKVLTARDMIVLYNNISDDEVNLSGSIPDHSILTLKFSTNVVTGNEYDRPNEVYDAHANDNNADRNDIYFQRFNVKTLPQDFLESDQCTNLLEKLNGDVALMSNTQNAMDSIYKDFCDLYHSEMKLKLNFKNVHPLVSKKHRKNTKPFWNEHLRDLWKAVQQKEKAFLSCKDEYRRALRLEFYDAQKEFDRCYRKEKRKFQKNKINEIEQVSNKNPTEFWSHIRRLGPRQNNDIPMEVYTADGTIRGERNIVLHTWKNEFEKLYNVNLGVQNFDDDFLQGYVDQTPDAIELDEGLSADICESEVKLVIGRARNNKSVGFDNLPNEVLKNDVSIKILTTIFNKVFQYNLVPSIWNMAIIKPIPKSSLIDPRCPLQYRGISLLSTCYKLYTSILNNRISRAVERSEKLADEQNGFRRMRSCDDHLFSITSVIRNRKRKKLPTLIAFVDFEKAFDRVNRDLLIQKLRNIGLGNKMCANIKNIYSNCQCMVNVNSFLTDSFSSKTGVRQGDTLSPTLFNLYINDLAVALKASGKGLKFNENLEIATLLYADDLAILAESEENLQVMLEILSQWCHQWRMTVNVSKTKVIHFRIKSQFRTNFKFLIGDNEIEVVEKYKYLGLVLDEHLDFNVTTSVLAGSAGRALGAVSTKFNQLKGMGFNSYAKLYNTGVTPILDYGAGIWGYKSFSNIDAIQNRAIRFFLGTHRFASNIAINGDVDWMECGVRRHLDMFRLWNKLVSMDEDRLTKRVFIYDHDEGGHSGNWNNEISKLFAKIGKLNNYQNMLTVNLNYVKRTLLNLEKQAWHQSLNEYPKLRFYRKFKQEKCLEPYVYKVQSRSHRSILAQLRCGILPLKVETGRFTQIPLDYRLCVFCECNVVEDESHFLFHCSLYDDIRIRFIENYVIPFYPYFENLNLEQKLNLLMSKDLVKRTSEFVYNCYMKRRTTLYN